MLTPHHQLDHDVGRGQLKDCHAVLVNSYKFDFVVEDCFEIYSVLIARCADEELGRHGYGIRYKMEMGI